MTIDAILQNLSSRVLKGESIPSSEWLRQSFNLNVLIMAQVELLESLRQKVALKKLEVLKGQQKRNVSEADLTIEATDEYRIMRVEEEKLDQIKEFIRIAKKNADNF